MSYQVCKYYRYSAGISRSLAIFLRTTSSTEPTNYCAYADVSWPRTQAVIKKKRGIACGFVLADMECADCGKKLKSKRDVFMTLNRTSYICKKCSKAPITVVAINEGKATAMEEKSNDKS